MIQIFLLPHDRSTIYIPTVSRLEWETHRFGKVGTVKATLLNPNELTCELGSYFEVWEITPESKKRILKYRIYERTLHAHEMNIIAYDQLYVWVKSKESLLIQKTSSKVIEPYYKKYVHLQNPKYSSLDQTRMKNHWEFMEKCSILGNDSLVKNGIFVSDLIFQFAHVFHLTLEDIDYSDVPDVTRVAPYYTLKDFWGLPPRLTNQESVLDIINYYLDYFVGLYKREYVLYDGGDGLCYQQQFQMHTYLYFTLNVIGEYEIKQQLPKDYFNRVEFVVQSKSISETGATSYAMKPADRKFIDQDKMREVGVFHKKVVLGEISSYKEENGQRVVKTPDQLLEDQIKYYTDMNKNLYSNVDIMQLKNVRGSWKVRGGSIIKVEYYPFKNTKTSRFFYVNKVIHHYQSEENHTMDIEVKGLVL